MQPGESAGQQSQRRRSQAESLRLKAQALNESADKLDRSADMWSLGYAGEQTVGAQLELLRASGFDVLHDVRWPGRRRANIDHVAIGPPGVLVVDAKNWSGSVAVRNGVLRQNGYQRTREVEGVRQAGRDVAGKLGLPWALHVIPVIGLAGVEVAGVHRCHDVTVVGHRELVSWATGLPAQLAPGDVIGIASHLRTVLPSANQPAPPRAPNRKRGHGASRELSARERNRHAKRKAAGREAVVKLALIAALIVALPSLLAWWNIHGSDVVTAAIPVPTQSAASAPTALAPQTFANCRALRVVYPQGVKSPGAKNSGSKIQRGAVVDAPAYKANARLDIDLDGVACELGR